jgi:hypothetical protein
VATAAAGRSTSSTARPPGQDSHDHLLDPDMVLNLIMAKQ